MQSIREFNSAQVASLKAFLDAPGRSPDSMGYCEAAGFLFVVASAPELIQPAQWMPIIIDPDNAEEKSLESMKTITGGLISLYNEMTRQVQDADVAFPPDCSFRDDLIANLETDAPISQWSRGFTTGYNWLDEMWLQYTPRELKEEFGYQCSVLSFFCSPAMAKAYVNEVKNKDVTIESLGENMRRLFPEAMRGVAHLGFSIQQALLQRHSAGQQPVVRGDKVGRNDPCTCGSGKKYKKCCGGVLH